MNEPNTYSAPLRSSRKPGTKIVRILFGLLALGAWNVIAAEVRIEAISGSASAHKEGIIGPCSENCEVPYFRAQMTGSARKQVSSAVVGGVCSWTEQWASGSGSGTYITTALNLSACTNVVQVNVVTSGYWRYSIDNDGPGDYSFHCETTNANVACPNHLAPVLSNESGETSTSNYIDCSGNSYSVETSYVIATPPGGEQGDFYASGSTTNYVNTSYSDEYTTTDIINNARSCANYQISQGSYTEAASVGCAYELSDTHYSAQYGKAKWRLAIRGSKKGETIPITIIYRTKRNGIAETSVEEFTLQGKDAELWYHQMPPLEPETPAQCGVNSYSRSAELGCSGN